MEKRLEEFKKERELIENHFAKELYIKTPNGGDVIVSYFFDKDGKFTTEEEAYKIILREYKYDSKLIRKLLSERFLIKEEKEKNEDDNGLSL